MESANIKKNIECGRFKIITKRKGTSELWTIFGEIENDCGQVVHGWLACRECRNIYKYNGKSSSNDNRHKCYMNKLCSRPKKKMSAEVKNNTINVLGDWVIEDCRPFSAVAGNGFKKIAQFFIALGANEGENIDIDDLLPEPTTISRRVNKLAVHEKEKLKEEIPELIKKNKAFMTIDMWTDNFVKRNFLCATFHFEQNFKLQEIVLGMKSMDFMSSIGENIRGKLLSLPGDFGVNSLKNIKFITDKGSNIKNALKDETRINCSNHLLSNIVDVAFEENFEIHKIIFACKNIVKYFKKANLQHLLQTSLKNHCPTRWNSYLELFKSISENWSDINKILSEKDATHRLNDINYSAVTSLLNFCKDIDKISTKLQGTKYPTMCYVLPLIARFKIMCQTNIEDVGFISTLKENMLQKIDTKWVNNTSIWH